MQATMLPAAGLYLKDFYDTTIEFIALRSPTFRLKDTADSNRPEQIQDCSACQHHCNSSQSNSTMRRDLDTARAELSRSRLQITELEDRCKYLENALKESQEALKLKEIQLTHLTNSSKSNRRRSDPSQKRRSHISAIVCLEGSLELVSASPDQRSPIAISVFGDDMSIDQERAAHTKSLEIFLTKTDVWSGAQIIQTVLDLNSEVLQYAAAASEICVFDRCPQAAPPPGLQDIANRLGPKFSQVLATRDHTQDPILVQFALQGCISTLVSIALSSFCIGLQGKSNGILSTIYSRIASSEPQPTSARWRSLTHRHIHNLQPNLGEREVHELTVTILHLTSDIFLLSGCSPTSIAPSLGEGLRAQFGERARRIARAVCKLAQVTKEEILSTNFEVVAVNHTESFDVKTMQDPFGEYGPSEGSVLCTTELGLRCSTRISAESGPSEFERRLLLRPKVLLESAMDFL